MDQNKITFTTLEGMEEDNRRYWASLSPAERLALHYKMISRIFHDEILKNKASCERIIIFDE
jgi:hypothetical protein